MAEDPQEKIWEHLAEIHHVDTPPTSMPDPGEAPPRQLGNFVLQDELGRGGMGRVYRAYDSKLKRTVALKVIEGAHQAKRLEREAQASAILKHPGIVTVYEVGEVGDCSFLAMEFVSGEVLDKAWRGWDFRRKVEALERIAWTMAYAHENGVLHRDLKPGNVIVAADGAVKVLDFGLARVQGWTKITVTGAIMGTPGYMAPEQVRGDAVGPETDVYSLGVMLYEALAGCLPFTSDQEHTLFQKILAEEPRSTREQDRRIPVELDLICLKALEKKRGSRYRDAGKMAEDLRRWREGEPIQARPTSRIHRLWKRILRNPWPWGGGAIAVSALVAGALAIGWISARAARRETCATKANQAAVAYAVGDLESTARLAGEALAIDPDHREARYWLARLDLRKYQIHRGLPEVQISGGVVEVAPLSPETREQAEMRERIRRAFEGMPGEALAQGVLLLWDGRYEEALATLDRADPNSPGAWEGGFYSGQALYLGQRFQEAAERLRQYAGMDPLLVAAVLAQAYLARGLWGQLKGENPSVWFDAARAMADGLEKAGDVRAGRRLAATALAAWGRWHREYGQSVKQMDADARQRFQEALAKAEGLADVVRGDVLLDLAQLQADRGGHGTELFDQSIDAYGAAISADPSRGQAYRRRSQAYRSKSYVLMKFGQVSESDLLRAREDLQRAVDLGPEDWLAAVDLARTEGLLERLKLTNIEDSLASMKKEIVALEGLAKRSGHWFAYAELVNARTQSAVRRGSLKYDVEGDYLQAIEDALEGFRQRPIWPVGHSILGNLRCNLAMLHRQKGKDPVPDLRESVREYTLMLEACPAQADGYEERGRAHAYLAEAREKAKEDPTPDREEAIQDFTRAVGIDPSYAESFLWRAEMLAKRAVSRYRRGENPAGDVERAAQDIYRGLEVDESRVTWWVGQRGRIVLESLRTRLDLAIAQEPASASHRFHRGVLRWCLGRRKEANDDLNQALKLDPDLRGAIESVRGKP